MGDEEIEQPWQEGLFIPMYLLAGKIYTTVDSGQFMGERKFPAPNAFQASKSYEAP